MVDFEVCLDHCLDGIPNLSSTLKSGLIFEY